MNKIYKVIWSKVRNCYVAVSEIAKRNGKSCTSVNCSAKANRSHVALALSLALCVTGGMLVSPQAAWADGIITVSDAGQPQNDTTTTGGTLSYDFNTRVYYSTEPSIIELKITGGQIDPYYGFAGCLLDGYVSGHTVTVSGTDTFVGSVCGGITPFTNDAEHTVESNKVIVSGGKVDYVYGGMANSKNMTNFAKNNEVSIEAVLNGNEYTVTTNIFGGYASKNGEITGNSVNISSGKVNNVFGGYNYESGSVGGDGEGEGNKVTITGGTVTGSVYGGYVRDGIGSVIQNKVTIDTTGTGATGVSVQRVYGGKGNGSAEITGNEVSIRGSKTTVNISGSSRGEDGVYGGNSSGSGTVSKNTVTISNEAKVNSLGVYGGYSATGVAGGTSEDEGNKVTISDSTVSRESGQGQVVVMGGRSEGSGNSNYNGVAINNSLLTTDSTNYITGGRSVDGNTNFNKVTINGSTITTSKTDTSVHVYGGRSNSNTATGNIIALVNSTVKGIVAGGRSGLTADNSKISGNQISISGTDAENITETGDVYGGYNTSDSGVAANVKVGGEGEGNSVTISGYTKTGRVYGGYSNKQAEVSGNEVSITGGETGDVIGGESSSGSVTGNKVTIDTTATGATDVTVQSVFGGKGSGSAEISSNEVSIRGSHTIVNDRGGFDNAVQGGYSAGSSTVTKNIVTISDGATLNIGVIGGFSQNGNAGGTDADGGNKLTISSSTVNGNVFGGRSYESGNADYNTVAISDSTVSGYVMGGRVKIGNANHNIATVNNSMLTSSDSNRFVQGGRSEEGNADFNTVAIYGSTITTTGSSNYASIYGGRSTSGKADSNTVTIIGTTITTSGSGTAVSIYGGASDNKTTACNNNTVNLLGASKLDGKGSTNIYGSNETAGTGNELHIGGVKGSTATSSDNIWKNGTTNKVSSVNNFATIALHDVAWSTSVPALYAGKVSNVGTLDITSMKLYDGTTEKTTFTADEVMDLLKSDTDLSALKLKYNSDPADTVTTDGVTIATRNNTNWTAATDLTFSGDQTDKVKLNDTGKAIVYSVAEANTVKSAVLSATLAWNSSDTYAYYKNEKNTFTTGTTFDLSGFKITSDSALTENPVNKTMTLISGSVLGTTSQPKAVPSMDVSVTQANVVLDGTTSSGTAAIGDGKLTYKVTGVTLNSVTVNGAENGAVPDGWVAGTGKIEVAAGTSYTAPAAATTILSGTDALQFTETNTNIAEDIKYKVGAVESEAAAINGTTLTYAQSKGIKADGTNLVYAVGSTKDVTTITLGKVKDPRDMSGTDFDFAGTTKVDASNLELDITPSLDVTSPIVPLVTNAANLKTGVTVDYGTGKSNHSQDFSLTHGATGIGVGVTMTGIVATMAGESAGTVNYVATGATMNSLDLANWNGTDVTEDMSKVKGKAGGVTVTTGSFAEPTTVGKGEHIDIITTTTANFFGEVTGDKTFTEEVFADDTAKGVTLSGNKFGGVKATNDNKVLTYYGETMGVENVAFGTMTWRTGRAAAEGYDFTKVTAVDASGLEFTKPEEVTGSMDLLTNATNLAAGVAGNYGTGKSSHSQEFDKTLDNKAVITATLTGTIDTATAGKVSYTSTGISMSKFDLANWEGATASAIPTGWTLANGAAIETDGMTVPELEPGKHIDIIQSGTDNFFANATINGANVYDSGNPVKFEEEDGGITFAVCQSKGVTLNTEKKHVIYAVGTKNVNTATLAGEISWDTTKAYYTNKQYTFTDSSQVKFAADAAFTSTTDPLNQSMTLIAPDSAEHAVKGTVSGTPGFAVKLNNTTLEATATGTAAIESGNLKYTVNSVTLNQVNVAAVGSDAVPAGWSAATSVTVDTENMTVPAEAAYGTPQNILTATSAIFTDDNITGKNKYGATPAAFADTDNAGTPAVTIAGQRDQGVKASADGKSLVYEVGTKDASSVTLGSMQWASGTEVMDGSNVEYDYTAVTSLGTDGFAMAFEAPETVDASKGESMTLLKANATLKDMAEQVKQSSYSYNPVSGVTVDAAITGKLTTSGGVVSYTPMANQASKLTFTSVDWKDSGALMTRPSNITFAGADVDTTKIHFKNIKELDANKKMTLVSDFGDSVGTITGTKYTVGAGLEGEGAASLSGSDLVFTTKTGANDLAAQEQTHNTLMVMEAGIALLAAGNEHISQMMDSLAAPGNVGADGTAIGASMGGGASRYETGSHVSTHNWNAAVAVGSSRESKSGKLEWGVFGEYGKSSYKLHGNVGTGDGDSHYAGGGLMAKWTNKHDVYTEASVRLGRLSDTANNLLRDAAGNGYGYDVHANYFGAHVGIGKIINYKGGKSLDVYGKYFYTKRDGVDFASGGNNYSLDSVASSVLRVGARYGTTNKKWNWYGGLAYEYEFDGKSEGTVDGVGIRAASVKGGSVRGEIGLRMSATKTNPWQTDISIYGYGGKHRGFGGSVNVAYMF